MSNVDSSNFETSIKDSSFCTNTSLEDVDIDDDVGG
jgi:hypothetical protein